MKILVEENGVILKKAVYTVLGYNVEGFKEVLGMYVGEDESSKYWLENILTISTNNHPSFTGQ